MNTNNFSFIKELANETLRVSKSHDFSDVGNSICQQKTAELFIKTLNDSIPLANEKKEFLLSCCQTCCFHEGELSSNSNIILNIAKLCSSQTAETSSDLGSVISNIVSNSNQPMGL